MIEDAGSELKARLRADLRAAMKDRRGIETKVIRALIAAIDNAEAPSTDSERTVPVPHRFHTGSAEVERLLLGRSQVQDVLQTEIHERECAAAGLERLEMVDPAAALRAEVVVAKRYLE